MQNLHCPYCGSGAQVKIESEPKITKNHILIEGFKCGCGCHFSIEYERNEIGYWSWIWTSVDYVEGSKNFPKR